VNPPVEIRNPNHDLLSRRSRTIQTNPDDKKGDPFKAKKRRHCPRQPRELVIPEPATEATAMRSPHVYDKAKWHDESVQQFGLPDEHAENHTAVFLRWLIEHNLMSEEFETDNADILRQFRAGKVGVHKVYESEDRCLIDDMLSDEGNAFAMHYFDFEKGRYLNDYVDTLQSGLRSELHIIYNEANYQKMRKVIDQRYADWKRRRRRS
jgi:hypothetical protein